MIYTCGNTGQSITLGKEIASGGEGIVWQTNRNGYVAKIYQKLPNFELVQKLEMMVASPPREPNSHLNHISFAWPKSLLKDANGNCVGFLMPAIANAKQLLDVYNPQRRKQQKLEVDWRFLHTTALNIASIIQAIHAEGYVLGDMKPQNILVNNRALPSIIDTDSFQVRHFITNEVYRCGVGSEGFTPPELIGKDFSTIDQTQVHDRFRIAVIIYHLLFGETPFKGKYMGTGDAPEPEELIRRGLWLYEPNNLIQPVANTISLNIVHPEVQQYFLKCFNNGHTQPNLRPSAADWVKALKIAVNELTVCGKFDSHYYSRTYGNCYWCERASKLGVDVFPGVAKPQPLSSVAAPTIQTNNQVNVQGTQPSNIPPIANINQVNVQVTQSSNIPPIANINQVNTQVAQSSNIPPIANTNQVNTQVAQPSSSGQQNTSSEFLLWLAIPSFCLVCFTCGYYISIEGLSLALSIWTVLVLFFGTWAGAIKDEQYTILHNFILALGLPSTGLINIFFNRANFTVGWAIVFSLSFFIVILALQNKTTSKINKLNFSNLLFTNIMCFLSLFITTFTLQHYIEIRGIWNIPSVIIWCLLAFIVGIGSTFEELAKLSYVSKTNLAISVPTLGVINCFINPKFFLDGWWLVFVIGFLVGGISLPQKTTNTNSTSKVSPKAARIKTIEVFTLIFVLGLAVSTYLICLIVRSP